MLPFVYKKVGVRIVYVRVCCFLQKHRREKPETKENDLEGIGVNSMERRGMRGTVNFSEDLFTQL